MRVRLAKLPKEAMAEITRELATTARRVVDAQLAFGVGPQGKAFEARKDGSQSNLGGHRDWIRIETDGPKGFRVVSTDKRVKMNMAKAARKTRKGLQLRAPGRPLMPYQNRLPLVWSVEFRKAITRAKNRYLKQLKQAQKNQT